MVITSGFQPGEAGSIPATRSKPMSTRLIAMGSILALLVGCAPSFSEKTVQDAVPQAMVMTDYYDAEHRVFFQYPQDWVLINRSDTTQLVLVFTSPETVDGQPQSLAKANFLVQVGPSPLSQEELFSILESREKTITELPLIRRSRSTLGGEPAMLEEVRGMSDGEDYTSDALMTIHNGNAYSLITGAWTDDYPEFEPIFQRVIDSFSFNEEVRLTL